MEGHQDRWAAESALGWYGKKSQGRTFLGRRAVIAKAPRHDGV